MSSQRDFHKLKKKLFKMPQHVSSQLEGLHHWQMILAEHKYQGLAQACEMDRVTVESCEPDITCVQHQILIR